jgi:putative selenate reductase FAD-binding subunit
MNMIRTIHRPETVDEALALLARSDVLTLPLGGGTRLSRVRQPGALLDLVDLQRLGLNKILREGGMLHVGATVTLEQLAACGELPEEIAVGLRESLMVEAGLNLRQMATMAGTLLSCDGRSPFVTALLALDPRLVWAGIEDTEGLGDFLALRQDPLSGGQARLMTEIRIPLNGSLWFDSVARSPLDRPVVCVAVGRWPSGRTRVTLGGYSKAPILAMDGPEPVGAGAAARDAYLNAGDAWASAEYRAHVAGVLASRLAAAPAPAPRLAQETEPADSEEK